MPKSKSLAASKPKPKLLTKAEIAAHVRELAESLPVSEAEIGRLEAAYDQIHEWIQERKMKQA